MAHQPPYNQPHQQQNPPYAPPYGQQQPAPVYYQQPPQPQPVPVAPRHGRVVSKHRMGAGGHSIHATLTLFTCGMWAPVWFVVWLLKRGKTVTRY